MIPLKIETLLEGRVVEHDRVEYKNGWNPDPIIHSICAFANDYDNINGGYIFIGVREKQGMPVFPIEGLENYSRKLICPRRKVPVFLKYYVNLE